MNLLRPRRAAAILAFLPLSAGAHPGHALHDVSLIHLLTSPDHLTVLTLLGAVGAVLLLIARIVHQRPRRRAPQAAGAGANAAAGRLLLP